MTQPLHGLSILVVEDEIITGLMLCHEVAGAGGISIGPVNSVADALKEIESQILDLVILDAKLVDGSGADLVARLTRGGIPYVVVSGYEEANLPRELRGAPFVAKPISIPVLMEAIDPALGMLHKGRVRAAPPDDTPTSS
jgi:CheY-like chemotaxis protein